MRKTRLLILLLYTLLGSSSIDAQTPISGVINTYHKVLSLDNLNGWTVVDDPGALAPGDKVMLVQMKGAGVSTSGSTFGDTLSLNKAGNYEMGTVCTVHDDTVFLLNTIKQQYTPADKVQLVYIPVYENAVVTGELKAAPWNNGTGKGGVLALSVTYSLFLNAPVTATGAGYWGGRAVLSSGDCNDYIYPSGEYYNANNTTPQSGAFKGESVWELSDPQFSGGKGAVANGGGGGNNHNNGGGGGANLSAGGAGGGNNSATTCTRSNPGEGAKALSSWGRTKIFMGGGGGAGHVNTGGILQGGGAGGGIVYVQAQTLVSSGYTISANGLKGGSAIGDGASGGGAGGTIMMNVSVYSDAVSLEANGGDGGQEDDELINYKCYGEGGGGSGGVIYMKTAPPAGTVSVAGGAKGAKINSMGNCKPAVPGSAGLSGVTATGYAPVQSTPLANSCTFVLPTTLLSFKATAAGADVTTRWQVVRPEDLKGFVLERKEGDRWVEVARLPIRAGVDVYTAADRNLPAGTYTYRLNMLENDGKVMYSPLRRVTVSARTPLTVYPNPAKGTLHVVLPPGAGGELTVYDMSGKLLIHRPVAERSPMVSLDVSPLQQGLYILRIGTLYKVFRIQ